MNNISDEEFLNELIKRSENFADQECRKYAVKELEKIKAEIDKCSDYVITNHNNTEADMNKLDGIILAITIIGTEITELKGENNVL